MDEQTRRKEWRAKLIILILIALLTSTFGAWNVWRMIESVRSPVITTKSVLRSNIPVPGVAVCGKTIDWAPRCYQSAFNAADDDHTKGTSCDDYLTTHRMDATNFVNMRGYDNLTELYCYVLNPSQKINGDYGSDPLMFNNNTQKIAIVLNSSENANNTLLATTADRWFFFGTFTENEDPAYARFRIVKMPSISYLYFKRTERYDALKSDAIIGTGNNGGSEPSPGAVVEYDTSFTSFAISGFALSPNLWEILRIIPSNYITDTNSDTQKYPVVVERYLIDFTLLQMAANMGGFVSILSASYFILFGSRRVNPWGIVQRYVLKNIPSPPALYTPTVVSHSDLKEKKEEPKAGYDDEYQQSRKVIDNLEIPTTPKDPITPRYHQDYESEHQLPFHHHVGQSQIGTSADNRSPEDQLHQEYMKRYSITQAADLEDPRILRIRHELRAEVQRTIANELAKLRLFLSKYYLKDIVKTE